MPVNIIYIISDIDKAISFEWIVKNLNYEKFNLTFILINSEKSYLKQYLLQKKITVFDISCKKKINLPLAIFKCISILRILKADVVHCHLFFANIIGLTSAKIAGVKKRIYTRHYSTYHHDYFPHSVKWDKLFNLLSTNIIAISEIVKQVLIEKENVKSQKISLIHHGFDLSVFEKIDTTNLDFLNKKYNPEGKWPVIGVISRFTELKGIQYILPAYEKVLGNYSNALLLMFNAHGDYENEINKLLYNLPPAAYKKIKFENDIITLYNMVDIFIQVPINKEIEAFGQTYVESLAAGIPSVFTLSGIANEFIKDRENAIVVPYENSEAIYNAIMEILNNKELRNKIILNGKRDVQKLFQLSEMIYKLEELYIR